MTHVLLVLNEAVAIVVLACSLTFRLQHYRSPLGHSSRWPPLLSVCPSPIPKTIFRRPHCLVAYYEPIVMHQKQTTHWQDTGVHTMTTSIKKSVVSTHSSLIPPDLLHLPAHPIKQTCIHPPVGEGDFVLSFNNYMINDWTKTLLVQLSYFTTIALIVISPKKTTF